MADDTRTLRPWDKHPFRIGVLNDLPGIAGDLADDWVRAIELAFEEARARGRLDREVEVLRRDVYAQPWNSAAPMVAAYRELVEEQSVLGVIGPMSTDNSLCLLEEIERLGVPLISMCGSQRMAGPRVFVLSQGSLCDEPPIIVDWVIEQGFTSCAILYEATQIGLEYLENFYDALATRQLEVVASAKVAVLPQLDELTDTFKRFKAAEPGCLVYLGFGMLNTLLNPALEGAGWEPVRIMSTAFVTASMGERWARSLDGWYGLDEFDERNPIYVDLLDRYERKYGARPNNAMFPCGYDMAHAMAEGLARMRIMTPGALAEGLERVRRLPAAAGSAGTRISLGPWDHRGYSGEYLVVRRAVDGTTVLAERPGDLVAQPV